MKTNGNTLHLLAIVLVLVLTSARSPVQAQSPANRSGMTGASNTAPTLQIPHRSFSHATTVEGIRYAAPAALGAGDCSSWSNACTLQSALAVAISGDEVWVQQGVHKPTPGTARDATFQLKTGVALYGGFAGTETAREQRDFVANVTVLSGDIDGNDLTDPTGVVTATANIRGANSYHVVTGSSVDSSAVLDGVFITAGQANGEIPNNNGGGMLNHYSGPTLENITFSGNLAIHDGGGMANYNCSSLALTNVTFSGNQAGFDGGGLYSNACRFMRVTHATFMDNIADNDGGGMKNYASDPLITDAVFIHNAARYGGGLFNGFNELGSPTLVKVIFSGNRARHGGGMYQYFYSDPKLTNVIFSGNQAAENGGAMYNWNHSASILTNVSLAGNWAGLDGGAIYNGDGSSPLLQNVIAWSNESGNPGPAIFNDDTYEPCNPAIRYSLVQGCNPGGSWNSVCGASNGNNLPDADPLFVAPEPASSAPTTAGDYRLQTASPAVNAGDNAADLDGSGPFTATLSALPFDLDGNPRIVRTAVDLGPYEHQGFPCPAGGVVYVDADAPGPHTGASWGEAFAVLQDALSVIAPCEIWVADGVYYPDTDSLQSEDIPAATFQLTSGIALYGGFAGTETARDQRDWTANLTILSGDIDQNDLNADGNFIAETWTDVQGTNAYHVLTAFDTNATAVLDGFVITAGGQWDGSHDRGGGVYSLQSSPMLANLRFSGNLAKNGAGLFSENGSPVLSYVTFSGNRAFYGGGMTSSLGAPTLASITFDGNQAVVGGGLALYSSSPTLTGVTFSDNTGGSGGGMYNDQSNPTLVGVTFSANTGGTEGSGAGMYNVASAPTLINVAFLGNTVSEFREGGGMLNVQSNPQLMNVTFRGNTAGWGGGMHNSSSAPTLANVSFTGNAAGSRGGGMFNAQSNPTLTNVTVSGNAAYQGGGIYNNSSNPLLQNTIVWGNQSDSGNPGLFNFLESTPTLRYSLVQGCHPGGLWDDTCGDNGGHNLPDADPLFVAPEPASSAPTTAGDYRLQDASPAINAGDNAADLDGAGPLTATIRSITQDLGANPRFVRVIVDLGAHENQAFPCPAGGILYVDQAAAGQQTGASWSDALVTLQDALQVTEACEIWAAAGVYYPDEGGSHALGDRSSAFRLKTDVALYGGFDGEETTRDERDPAVNITVLSGDLNGDDNANVRWDEPSRADNASNVVIGATGATLDGFTITGGNADGTADKFDGAGMFNMSSNPTLANITFSNNSARYYGGGIYVENGSAVLANVTFSGNDAANSGGGVYIHTSSITLTNVTFNANSAFIGGGLYNVNSNPILANVDFISNSAQYAGGMGTGGSPVLTNVSFSGNVATNDGGAYIGQGGNPTLTNVAFNANSAGSIGGGMLNLYSSNPVLTNVTFANNHAALGGGMANRYSSGSQIQNTIFWGTMASGSPAQIFNDTDGTSVISDSIVQGGCPVGSTCVRLLNADPLFVGAATDLRLRPGSPAIDAGNNLSVTVATDLAGGPRLVDIPAAPDTGLGTPPLVDMGAYEAHFVDAILHRSVTPQAVSPGEAITFTLSFSNGGSITATHVIITDRIPNFLETPSIISSGVVITDTGALPPYVWSVQNLAPGQGGRITITGNLSIPVAAGLYTNTATVAVSNDAAIESNTASATFSVRNIAPVFTSVPVTVATQDAPYTCAVAATDSNGDALTFAAPVLPAWLTLTGHAGGTATLSGTPANADVGSHPVTVRVSDGHGLFATQTFTITVANINDAPTFTSVPITTTELGFLYTYTITATDPDLLWGDALTLTAPTLPEWLVLTDHGDGTATLAGAPTLADVGHHAIIVHVTDSAGLTAAQTFVLTVRRQVYLPQVLRNSP